MSGPYGFRNTPLEKAGGLDAVAKVQEVLTHPFRGVKRLRLLRQDLAGSFTPPDAGTVRYYAQVESEALSVAIEAVSDRLPGVDKGQYREVNGYPGFTPLSIDVPNAQDADQQLILDEVAVVASLVMSKGGVRCPHVRENSSVVFRRDQASDNTRYDIATAFSATRGFVEMPFITFFNVHSDTVSLRFDVEVLTSQDVQGGVVAPPTAEIELSFNSWFSVGDPKGIAGYP